MQSDGRSNPEVVGSIPIKVKIFFLTVFYRQIENGKIANQIHGFTIDYG